VVKVKGQGRVNVTTQRLRTEVAPVTVIRLNLTRVTPDLVQVRFSEFKVSFSFICYLLCEAVCSVIAYLSDCFHTLSVFFTNFSCSCFIFCVFVILQQ